jgi:hypothetical protein
MINIRLDFVISISDGIYVAQCLQHHYVVSASSRKELHKRAVSAFFVYLTEAELQRLVPASSDIFSLEPDFSISLILSCRECSL